MLKYLTNKIYAQNETMQQIIATSQEELDRLDSLGDAAFDDNFALTAHLEGIQNYERILNIVPDPTTEDLEFRRQRILRFLSGVGPYTKFFLIKYLDAAVGAGNYRIAVNVYAQYNLFVRLANDYLALENEIKAYLRRVIPSNMTLDLAQLWATWHDVLTRYLTWENVLNASRWVEYKGMDWGDLFNTFWIDVFDPDTWGDIKEYRWED